MRGGSDQPESEAMAEGAYRRQIAHQLQSLAAHVYGGGWVGQQPCQCLHAPVGVERGAPA